MKGSLLLLSRKHSDKYCYWIEPLSSVHDEVPTTYLGDLVCSGKTEWAMAVVAQRTRIWNQSSAILWKNYVMFTVLSDVGREANDFIISKRR